MLLLTAIRGGSRGYRSALLSRAHILCQVPSRFDDKQDITCHPTFTLLASQCTRPLLKDASFAEVLTR